MRKTTLFQCSHSIRTVRPSAVRGVDMVSEAPRPMNIAGAPGARWERRCRSCVNSFGGL